MRPGRIAAGWLTLVLLGALVVPAPGTGVARAERLSAALGPITAATVRMSSPDKALIPRRGAKPEQKGTPHDNTAGTVYGSIGGHYEGSTFVPNVVAPGTIPTQK